MNNTSDARLQIHRAAEVNCIITYFRDLSYTEQRKIYDALHRDSGEEALAAVGTTLSNIIMSDHRAVDVVQLLITQLGTRMKGYVLPFGEELRKESILFYARYFAEHLLLVDEELFIPLAEL